MDHAAVSLASARLRAVKGLRRRIQKTVKTLGRMPREEVSPAGIWILDHGRFLLGEAETLARETRRGPRLPALRGEARILRLARKIVSAGEGEVTAPGILRAAREFFGDEEPVQEELYRLPAALSLALLEEIDVLLESCLREAEKAAAARRWAARFAAGKARSLPQDREILALGLALLSRREEAGALHRADALLRREGRLGDDGREGKTALGLRAGRLIASLRRLPRLPLDGVIERLNPVAAVLRGEDTYRRMDDAGRALYRQGAARIARKYGVSESAAARAALALTAEKEGAEGQAGYYLLEKPERIGEYLLRRGGKRSLRRRTAAFLTPLYGGALLSVLAAAAAGMPPVLWPLAALCASEVLRWGYFSLLRRALPPRPLPRLQVKRLGPEMRTLAVIPTLLTNEKQALRMVRQLSVLHCANPDPYLDFMLLADFPDSDTESQPGDEGIVSAAREALRALRETAGGGFYYLHRARQWDGERFAGRERKRGALDLLNHLLTDGEQPDALVYSSCDVRALKGRYRYVITLDADTFLPPGAACRLVGSMAHPLQKGRVGVIQPRMEVAADTVATRIQRWLGGPGGTDPYGLARQDVYQDVFGRGSFVGKGIYQPDLWMARLAGRLPAMPLLSHDLAEGEIALSALASDIVLYDGHPATLAGWQKRLHRWTRGDWQLLPMLFDWRLPLLSRHKIWDNLRRSLVPAAQAALLILGAAARNPYWMLLALPWPLRGMLRRLLFLPGKAYTLLDAAARGLYRRLISHRKMLEWAPAAQADGGQLPLPCVLAQVFSGAGMAALSLLPGGLLPGALVGVLWLSGPLWQMLLDRPLVPARPMTAAQRDAMRDLAKKTWRFFEDSVGKDTLFLPPDNVQSDPPRGPALRTSPTNIGLYLLSCCAAREMGFIPSREMGRRMSDALDTLETWDTWKGHFYNWYDLASGAPLQPRFVSTVDSGNLAGCLFACAQFCRQRMQELPPEMRSLPGRLDGLFSRMDFSALYDRREQLFLVGYDAQKGRPTSAHYDLMASEARLASFLAVMGGQAPLKHWQRLNRSTALAGGGAALLSWGGTMFEYLMPNLLLPLTPGTLLGEGCRCAVRAQMAHQPRRPFGISESCYYAFDADMNYQYRAFGLPSLALTGETAGQVIAPYASALALPFFPRSAAGNIMRMLRLGWGDEHGLIEAADYSVGLRPRLVRCQMAHHQGMILCALCNALHHNALVRAFMAPPIARAYGYLLLEQAPGKARRRPSLPMLQAHPAPPGPCRRTPRTGLPVDAHALSSGNLTWLLTAGGQGYLAWKQWMLTRFRSDAGEETGVQLYLRSALSGQVFRPMAEGKARFESGGVSFSAEWERIRLSLACCCAPLSAAAVMRLTMENTGKENRELDAVTYLEPALSSQQDDRAHPNYRDLSVRVAPWNSKGLIARRLPRDERDRAPLLAHFALGEYDTLRRQGDRALFLGRLGTCRMPDQLRLPSEECAMRTGDVLFPCLSLRAGITLAPGEKKTIDFITLCREDEKELTDSLLRPSSWRDAFALAYTQDQMNLRSLGMDGGMLHKYQQILGAVAFTGQPHQGAEEAAPRHALWRLGVSGTLPVWMVSLAEADETLIRHALRCHAWMRSQGVKTDLIFFCPEEGQYRRPIQDAVHHALSLSPCRFCQGAPGGVTVASGSDGERQEAERLSRLTLRSGIPLQEQLRSLIRPAAARSAALAFPRPVLPGKWRGDNSFGGFTAQGDYGIVRPCPMPWHNLLCGPRFGTLVCETGILFSYAGNSRLGRLTRMNDDVRRGVPGEEIYLRDEQGDLYPLTMPTALHSPGVTEYRCLCGKAFSALTVFTPESAAAGVRALTVRSEEGQRVTVYWAVHFSLGEQDAPTRCRVRGEMALADNGEGAGVAWAVCPGARCRILPSALYSLSCLEGEESGGGSVAVFSLPLTVQPHGRGQAVFLLGFSGSEAAARADAALLMRQDPGQMEREVRALWQKRLGGLTLFAGEEDAERMMNVWLPCQVLSARLFARMGPYQAGGAIGFRDQLQDLLILLHTDPDYARRHILSCAAHQFQEGDVQHWWHPPRRGVRTRISDDRLFLPFMTARYVKITGDQGILREKAPYLESAPLLPEEQDRYEEPGIAVLEETLLQHCVRAIDSVRFGVHGLPLMGGGDWNDGMNRVGGERGESVWLCFFLIIVLREFMPLCGAEEKEKYQALRRRLLDAAESAWTGQWYLRAWYDDGRPLAGPDTDPPRIDLISQAFAVLAGAPRAHGRTALMNALRILYDREAGLVKLLAPPFPPEEKAGYIGAYLPGVRENGGQYTHAVPWLILALCKAGEYEWAWEIARVTLPVCHGDTKEKALVYQVEPYVMAGDVYAGENRGRGGWTWYTGSAAWTYYVWLTALLGFDKRGSQARLTPSPGSGMEEFTLVYRFGASRWHFTASRDTVYPTLDGEKLTDGWVTLTDDGKTHEARYPMKA